MGLLKFLGISNPLTDYLEEELSKKVVDLLRKEGNNIPDNWRITKGALRNKISSKTKELLEEQNEKIKPNWKEFKGKISQLVSEAIIAGFAKSKLDNYSHEKSWEIIAVSKNAIREKSLDELILLLHKQIGIADLEDGTITALGRYAFNIQFNEQLKSLKEERKILDVDYRDYVIVEWINNDRYYIDDEKTSQQIEMIFLSEISKFTSWKNDAKEERRENRERAKTSFERWADFKKSRPNDRRFYINKW